MKSSHHKHLYRAFLNMSDIKDRIDKEMARSLRLRFWKVHAVMAGTDTDLSAHLDGHLAFMSKAVQAGRVFAAGPLLDLDGKNTGEGMMILRGDSIDDIKELLGGDPFFSLGIRNYSIQEWQVNVGTVHMSVNIKTSDGLIK